MLAGPRETAKASTIGLFESSRNQYDDTKEDVKEPSSALVAYQVSLDDDSRQIQ